VHTFAVEKTSALFSDAELTEEELTRAIRIRTLFLAQLPEAFRAYVRRLRVAYTVIDQAQATLSVHVDMVLQDPGAEVTVCNDVVMLEISTYDRMVANTTVSLIAGVLAAGAREGGPYASQYRDAARMLPR
jgi:hypothetical protein